MNEIQLRKSQGTRNALAKHLGAGASYSERVLPEGPLPQPAPFEPHG
jgi:hypothetical protein